MSAITRVLDRLERVKAIGPNRWVACCPVHRDRTPSLSIRETDDRRVLLHDFGGCAVGDVLAAIGLELRDLFNQPLGQQFPPTHSRIPVRDLLELAGYEIDVAGILLIDIVEGRGCSEVAWQRLAQSAERVNAVRSHMNGR
ncbi:MAG: CHC2 zinc finger domain-containing protein [Steroidobacteraceae bacterium]